MLGSIDNCQNKVSADQHHVTISGAHVYSSSRSNVFLKLTADQVLVLIGSRAHVWLTCGQQDKIVWKPAKANPGLKAN